jgi:hypothetical protein
MTAPLPSTPTTISSEGLTSARLRNRLPLLGWAGVSALLLAEVLAVSLRFDA